MKQLKLTFIILCLCLLSCKKEEKPKNQLVGEWELRTSINGLSGERTDYSPGNGDVLKFTATNYERWQDTYSVINKGTYTIRRYVTYLTKTEESQIVYDGITDTINSYFTIDGDSLHINIDANDGPAMVYVRTK